MFRIDEDSLKSRAVIKVVGVGGGGGNAIRTMEQSGLSGVQFIAANTDLQALEVYEDMDQTIQLGTQLTKGLGAGANPEIGRQAAIESCDEIVETLKGADMVFVTAGMGGGTGTGAAGVIARIAKEQGALTVGVVTRPFFFEGQRRARHAETGVQFLKENVDTLIVIPNQKLLNTTDEDTSLLSAFKSVDNILLNAVRGIVDLINQKGLINLDFADVKTIMSEKGMAIIGSGEAEGQDRALTAGQLAISSPLLEDTSFKGALGLIINITGGPDLSLKEVNQTAEFITKEAHPDAEIIFGAVVDPNINHQQVKVTVIATGFENNKDHNIDISYTTPDTTPNSNKSLAKVSSSSSSSSTQSITSDSDVLEKNTNDKESNSNLENTTNLENTASKNTSLTKNTPHKLPKDILLEKARTYQSQKESKVEQTDQHTQLSMNINNKKVLEEKPKEDPPFKKYKPGIMSLFRK